MSEFQQNLSQMIEYVQAALPRTKILLTTPPPSYFRRAVVSYTRKGKKKRSHRSMKMSYSFNDNARRLSAEIMRYAEAHAIAAFDLFSAMGGESGMSRWISEGLIASDRVHYSVSGYERQGRLLADALLMALK